MLKKELLDPVLDGYTAIIRDLLESANRFRFNHIMQIAKMAHALCQATATRVGHIDDVEIDYVQVGHGDYLQVGHGQRPTATEDILREVVGAFQPIIGLYMQRERLNVQRAQEQRLGELVTTRASLAELRLPTDAIDQRIEQLNVTINEEGREDVDPSVVHPELLRGHQADGDRCPELQRDHGEPDSERVGGAQEAPTDSDHEGLVLQGDKARMGQSHYGGNDNDNGAHR